MNINFKNIDDLILFLMDTKEFNDWETIIFRMSAANGMELNINTKINDTFGFRQYTEFKKLKTLLNNFYTQNEYLSINLEIKLKFPDNLKMGMDPSNEYESFNINFFSDAMSTFATASFVEKTKELNDKPVKNWIIYIMNLYNTWDKKRQL